MSLRTGVRWIAEFRDLWPRHHTAARPPGLRRRIDQAIERRIVARANLVLTVTEDRRLAVGCPILAIVPAEGETATLLRAAGNARIVSGKVSAIEEAIAAEIEAWRSGIVPAALLCDVVERYRYDRLARKLAALLEEEVWTVRRATC